MSTSEKLLRWLCAAPAGIIAAALVMFPLHWLVMINLGGWGGNNPIIAIRDPKTLLNIEWALQAVFGPLAFVYCAARTASSHRQITSILLSGLIVLGLPIIAWYWNAQAAAKGSGIIIEQGVTRILANLIGTAAAVLLIRSRERKQLSQ